MRIFIVDDHPVVRAGLVALINGEADLTIVGESDGAGAVSAIAALAPDVVLMDIQLGTEADGVALTRQLRDLHDPPQVLMLTTYESEADIMRAVDAGAVGYLLKACPPGELFAAIRSAARGETVMSPKVATAMMRRMRSPRPSLTAREIEILQLVAEGVANRQIARRLFLTEATVKTHLVHIYHKLGVSSRTAAVTAAVEQRLIRLR